ncbi:WXG100 family type VII secretion target [Streptomyces sp. SID12488]|uniref:WXG100 family type VII secretion target n=1 Tax=Streptomyces sp. SID12488 TaxID=2706040 RepID=UPI0013DA7C8F|nr:WXG100 family type VII secretion target [Streptomyces sp. SID12488]NEA68410.1 WXG100 family type VII secretion target [Streptomyces sp. SID12488]
MDFSEGYIHHDYGQAERSMADMQDQSDAIAGIIEQLNQDLAALKETWIGDDRDVYTDVQAKWDGAVTNIRTLLHNHSGLLEKISADYRHSEQSRTQRWGEIRIGSR